MKDEEIIRIQAWFRGCMLRKRRLPLIIYQIQKYLQSVAFKFSHHNDDGRINSSLDESNVSRLLSEKFKDKIKTTKIRTWYDLLAHDHYYGWLPVNIKTTSTMSNDNVGNLAMCVYAYTDEIFDIHCNKTYKSGEMGDLLNKKLSEKNYNKSNKKDYYFIVLNKKKPGDIIVNSVRGLTLLAPNINNLP